MPRRASEPLCPLCPALHSLGRRPSGSDASVPVRRTNSSGPQGQEQALTPKLQSLSLKYRGLAREALRTLRLRSAAPSIFHLQVSFVLCTHPHTLPTLPSLTVRKCGCLDY